MFCINLNTADILSLFRQYSVHCLTLMQNLETLLFTGRPVYTFPQLAPIGDGLFLYNFAQLKVLDISRSTANDDCMSTIGAHCPHLKLVSKRLFRMK